MSTSATSRMASAGSSDRRLSSRRGFLSGVGALGALVVAGACGGNSGGEGSGSSGGGGGSTRVTWQTWGTDPVSKECFTTIARDFEKAGGPTIADEHVAVAQFRQKLPSQLTSNSPPDIFQAGNDTELLRYVDRGLVGDVTSVWDALGDGYPANLRHFAQKDGKQYFLPFASIWVPFFYNKSVFEKNGLEPPTTWDQLIALCGQIQKLGIVPIALGMKAGGSVANYFSNLVLRMYGVEAYNEIARGEVPFTDQRITAVLDEWKRLVPYYTPSAASYEWVDQAAQMAQGKAAMQLIGSFMIGNMGEEQRDDFGQFFFPVVDPSVPDAETVAVDGFAMSAKARNADGAKEFLEFLGSEKAQNTYLRVSKSTSAAAISTKVDTSFYSPLFKAAFERISNPDLVTVNSLTRIAHPDLAAAMGNNCAQFVAEPDSQKQVQQTLEGVRAQVTG